MGRTKNRSLHLCLCVFEAFPWSLIGPRLPSKTLNRKSYLGTGQPKLKKKGVVWGRGIRQEKHLCEVIYTSRPKNVFPIRLCCTADIHLFKMWLFLWSLRLVKYGGYSSCCFADDGQCNFPRHRGNMENNKRSLKRVNHIRKAKSINSWYQ